MKVTINTDLSSNKTHTIELGPYRHEEVRTVVLTRNDLDNGTVVFRKLNAFALFAASKVHVRVRYRNSQYSNVIPTQALIIDRQVEELQISPGYGETVVVKLCLCRDLWEDEHQEQ